MNKHVKSTGTYFEVRGPRREIAVSPKGTLEYTGAVLPAGLRFEALSVRDAESFASGVFRREKIVCEIHEVRR